MSGRVAVYPGSFDPMTLGHLDILESAAALFSHVVVGIGVHPGKAPMFTFEERARLIDETVAGRLAKGAITVAPFEGLVVDFAAHHGAVALIRGVRDGSDLDYEMQMAGMNGVMAPVLRTVFLPAAPERRPITATLVRQIAAMGGDVSPFVPAPVATALKARRKA